MKIHQIDHAAAELPPIWQAMVRDAHAESRGLARCLMVSISANVVLIAAVLLRWWVG